jgi:prepilin-type N-terminal cleavage/methylation domain-containing protein
MCNARHGFSALELVVVLALVGILAAIALPAEQAALLINSTGRCGRQPSCTVSRCARSR